MHLSPTFNDIGFKKKELLTFKTFWNLKFQKSSEFGSKSFVNLFPGVLTIHRVIKQLKNSLLLSNFWPHYHAQPEFTVLTYLYGRIKNHWKWNCYSLFGLYRVCKGSCLYKLVSCGKFVNDLLFSTIYKTYYLTLGHHALVVILCLCLYFFELSTA